MIGKKYTIKNFEKEDITKEISSYLSSRHEEIIMAYLYGSFVKEKTFSDIDLALYSQMNIAKPLDFEFMIENELEKIIKFPMDVRVINSAPLSFCQRVIYEGRLIIDKDPNHRADFEGKILKKYFDFAIFHQRYLAEVQNAPI
ncbi:nucleotidyltransferase domain-containing protein [Thermodesulfobacteriota bacterium]